MNTADQECIKGICHFWSETGTEGGYWAVQDERFIHPPTREWPYAKWEYQGLHVLQDGDRLTIYDKNDREKIVWEGTIKLRQHPLFTQSASGMWIHADQEGVDRQTWAGWFHKEYPATLIPDSNHKK